MSSAAAASRTQEQLKAAVMAAQGNSGEQSQAVSRAENTRSPRPGAPRHPIRSMQGPFEESIEDATNPPDTKAQDHFNKLDPRKRRQRLLDADSTNGTYNEQWRTRASTAKFHPLTKVISQVAFGVHLLHQQLAKSDEDVVKILQKHVDDVDNFVQRAEEDLDLAISDIRERINYLKLPLEHAGVFDVMLDDKAFRTQILDGNEKIEKVVDCTAGLVKDLQVDVQKGMESTIDFGKYLDDISDNWPENDRGSIDIFRTMQANVEGWVQCMSTLQMKGNGLSVAVVQLGSTLSEMAKRAASASRREQRRAERAAKGSGGARSRSASSHKYANSSSSRATTTRRRSHHKPLPSDPDLVATVVEATLPGAKLPHRERSRDRYYDDPRHAPPPPKSHAGSVRSAKSSKSTRDRKPPPIHIDKMPAFTKTTTSKSEGSKRSKMSDFANVFRFHNSTSMNVSAAPSPMTSPGLPRPGFPASESVSPMGTPRHSTLLPSRKAVTPPEPVEMDGESNAIFELDNDAQATLIEARSKLREKQSQEVLSAKLLQTSTFDHADKNSAASPAPSTAEATDSAYSSSPEFEQPRPTTSPDAPRPPAIGALGIFPSASMTSLPSMVAIEQDRQSDKMSITSLSVTALPTVTAPSTPAVGSANVSSSAPREPSRLRHGSVPAVLPTLKKRTSFSALKKFFGRRSASAEPTSRVKVVEEKPEVREKDKENKAPIATKSGAMESLIELPG